MSGPLETMPAPEQPALPRWREPLLVPLTIAGVAAAPAAWWVTGLIPESVDPQGADYYLEPLSLAPGVEVAIGVVATLVTLAGMAALWQRVSTRQWSARWVGVLGPTFAIAAYVGAGYRVFTAPTIGANIGAGLVVFGAVPLLLAAVVCVVLSARRPSGQIGRQTN